MGGTLYAVFLSRPIVITLLQGSIMDPRVMSVGK